MVIKKSSDKPRALTARSLASRLLTGTVTGILHVPAPDDRWRSRKPNSKDRERGR